MVGIMWESAVDLLDAGRIRRFQIRAQGEPLRYLDVMALERRLSRQPLWLSSAGLGIYWLHLRLDSRPKNYSFQPYRVQPKPALSQGG